MILDYRCPINLEEYSKSNEIETETDDWSGRTFFSQMLDVWGQADKALKH